MTTFTLKLLAVIAMTMDHAAQIFRQAGLLALFPELSLAASSWIISLMQVFGRIAFPIYAFLIAEGAGKTRSMPKYIGRLALFAVISEPFFFFANHGKNAGWGDFLSNLSRSNLNNVFVTLALGASGIYAYQLLQRMGRKRGSYLYIPVLLLICFIGGYLGCDYGILGIALIVALYFAKTKKHKTIVILIWSVILYILYQGMGNWSQIWTLPILKCMAAALSAVLICQYNGKRGRPVKWSFYLYYPAHLLALTWANSLL